MVLWDVCSIVFHHVNMPMVVSYLVKFGSLQLQVTITITMASRVI